MSSLAKILVAVTHRGSAPLGRAIRYYAFSRQRSGRPRATAGSDRIEPPKIEPGHTAGECRTLSNLFPDVTAVSTPSQEIDGRLLRSAGLFRNGVKTRSTDSSPAMRGGGKRHEPEGAE